MTAYVGVRGGSVTLGGKGGTYANVGIPGKGIYLRRKIRKKILLSRKKTHLMMKVLKKNI
tara:strand:+ start:424 stop:603 length:180 start_codon:yes stop_codon:yes gene_type:complete